MSTLIQKSDRIFCCRPSGDGWCAICRAFKKSYSNILTATRDELDLLDQPTVQTWFAINQPDVVVLAAAKVEEYLPIILIQQISY